MRAGGEGGYWNCKRNWGRMAERGRRGDGDGEYFKGGSGLCEGKETWIRSGCATRQARPAVRAQQGEGGRRCRMQRSNHVRSILLPISPSGFLLRGAVVLFPSSSFEMKSIFSLEEYFFRPIKKIILTII